MSDPIENYIRLAVNPVSAENRMNHLLSEPACAAVINKLQDGHLRDFINLVSFSNFLFRFVSRSPDAIYQVGRPLKQEIYLPINHLISKN